MDRASLDESKDTPCVGDASAVRRSLRSSTMAMRVEKHATLVTPSVESTNASHIEFPNAARHPAVTPHEHDAGVALATLAEFAKPAAKVKTEPQTPSDTNWQPTFPELVHAMVTETVATQPDLIEWIYDGEAFVVHDPVREYYVLETELTCFHTLTRCPYSYCIHRRVARWQISWRNIFAVSKFLQSMSCLDHHPISHSWVYFLSQTASSHRFRGSSTCMAGRSI